MRKNLWALMLFVMLAPLLRATQLSGTIKYPDGSGVTGRLEIKLLRNGVKDTCSGGAVVPMTAVTLAISNGAVQGAAKEFVPTNCMSPRAPYQVRVYDDINRTVVLADNWFIGGSSPMDVGTIVSIYGLPSPISVPNPFLQGPSVSQTVTVPASTTSTFLAGAIGVTPLTVKEANGQTADPFQIKNNAGTVIFGVNAAGTCYVGCGSSGFVLTNNGAATGTAVDLDNATPAAPANGYNIKWQQDASTPINLSGYLDTTTVGSTTWGSGSAFTFTFDGGINTDPTLVFTSGTTPSIATNSVFLGPAGTAANTAFGLSGNPNYGIRFATAQTGTVLVANGSDIASASSVNGFYVVSVGIGLGTSIAGGADVKLTRSAAATLQQGAADVNGTPVAQTLKSQGAVTGSDKPGGNYTVECGQGTGAGTICQLIFATSNLGSTGTTAQTFTTRLTLDQNGMSNATLDCDASARNNACTFTFKAPISVAGCNNATSGFAVDTPTANAAGTGCLGTAPNRFGVVTFADAATSRFMFHFTLGSDWISTGGLDLKLFFTGDTSSTNAIRWQVSTACVADTEDLLAPSFNATSAANAAGPTTAGQRASQAFAAVAVTNCAAGETMFVQVERIGADGGDTYAGIGQLLEVEVTGRRKSR